jgi:hypothetical protein
MACMIQVNATKTPLSSISPTTSGQMKHHYTLSAVECPIEKIDKNTFSMLRPQTDEMIHSVA